MKGAKIILHVKLPTFRAAKLKGFTVLSAVLVILVLCYTEKHCCVSCREALEHFVTALNLQRNSRGPLAGQKAVMSDNIWTTMRITVALLGRSQDLCDACDARDLDRFNREFNTE